MQTGSTQSVNLTGLANPSGVVLAPAGTALAFSAENQNPAGGAVGQRNVYYLALQRSGSSISLSAPQCLSCQSISSAGQVSGSNASGGSESPALSADGQWLVYQSSAGNALSDSPAPCGNGSAQVLMRHVQTGQTQRISPPTGLASANCGSLGSRKPSIDYSGGLVAFETDQALTSHDGNALSDVYLWQSSQPLRRISVGGGGSDTSAPAYSPKLSGNGKKLVFVSEAPNHDLSTADNNEAADIHSVSLDGTETISRLSRTRTGSEISAASIQPALNYDGSRLSFSSAALNLGASAAGQTGVFVRSNPSAPPKRSSAWWIPAESGWGLHIFDQGNLLAPTWFTYDLDGEPTWFLIAGARPDGNGNFSGELFRFTGTPFAAISGPAAQTVTAIGTMGLSYSGETRLRFDYQIGNLSQTKFLQRFPFASRDIVCSASPGSSRAGSSNYTDLWSGAGDNAGWGLTLYHFDSSLVAVWYTYDSDGEAVFFVINTQQTSPGHFAGDVFRQRNGTPFSAIDGALASPGADRIGGAAFAFLDGETARFSYDIDGVQQTRPIQRLQVGSEASDCRVQTASSP